MNKDQMIGRAIALGAVIFCGFNTPLSRLENRGDTANPVI
jgi:hypothetical protein